MCMEWKITLQVIETKPPLFKRWKYNNPIYSSTFSAVVFHVRFFNEIHNFKIAFLAHQQTLQQHNNPFFVYFYVNYKNSQYDLAPLICNLYFSKQREWNILWDNQFIEYFGLKTMPRNLYLVAAHLKSLWSSAAHFGRSPETNLTAMFNFIIDDSFQRYI